KPLRGSLMTAGFARSAALEVVDESVLAGLGSLGGRFQPEFMNRFITSFIESALTPTGQLRRPAAERNLSALHHSSPALKSCSATIGASSLADRCQQLEVVARAGSLPEAPALVDAIADEYQHVQAALITRLAHPTTVGASAG